MSRSKKIMALFLSIVMVLGLLPASAFAANDTSAFSDVKTSAWYHEDVQYVSENGLMKGTGENLFSPDATTTRGMIVTILYRLEGEPSPTGACPFQDVASGKYYEKAITWAAENGIVSGFSADTFGPDQNITREQMAAILYRYATYKKYDVSTAGDLSKFPDADKVSSYAVDAMKWANAAGLINGSNDGKLYPAGNATRAQVAAILTRFCKNITAQCTVTFQLNYGSEGTYTTLKVAKGDTITAPKAPTRSGYTFSSWSEKTSGSAFDFKTPIEKNITLYAQWNKKSSGSSSTVYYYTVTFEALASDATDVPEAQQVRSGQVAREPSNPSRNGYGFRGWYVDDAYTEAYDFTKPVTENITLYAKWQAFGEEADASHCITFDLNDGSSGVYERQMVEDGQKATKPVNEPSRDLYRFTGWYEEPSGAVAYDFNHKVTEDITLYAGWGSPDLSADGVYSATNTEETIYGISGLAVENNEATATVNVNSMSVLVVEFFQDNLGETWSKDAMNSLLNGTPVASVATYTPDYGELIAVSIPVEQTLPEYYIARARLLSSDGEDLCAPFLYIEGSQQYAKFAQKTIDDYAPDNVLNFDENDNTNFGVLVDNTKKIEVSDSVNKLTVNDIDVEDKLVPDHTYTFASPDTIVSNLATGDIVYVKNTQYLFKVKDITNSEDGSITIIPDNQAELTDFYSTLKVDMGSISDSEVQPYIDIIDVDTTLSAEFKFPSVEVKPKDYLSIEWEATVKEDVDIKMSYDVHLFGENYFEFSLISKSAIKTSASVSVSPSDDKGNNPLKYDLLKGKGKVSIPTNIPGLEAYTKLAIPIEVKLEAGLSLTWQGTIKSGFTYNTYTGRNDIKDVEKTIEVKAEGKAEVKVGPEVAVGVQLTGEIVTAEVNLSAGAKVSASIAASNEDISDTADSKHSCVLCISGKAKWFTEVHIKADYKISKKLKGNICDFKPFGLEGDIQFLGYGFGGEFYISVDPGENHVFESNEKGRMGGGTCPNISYRTELRTTNENGVEITGIPINIEKKTGKVHKKGNSVYVVYLHDGLYTANATVQGVNVSKSLIVKDNPQVVTLDPRSGNKEVSGKIIESENYNLGIENADIKVSKDGLVVSSAKSDSNGNFKLSLPDGRYLIEVTKNGYIPFSSYEKIENDQTPTQLQTIKLIPGKGMGGFRGIITDAVTGNIIQGVTLSLRYGWNNSTNGDVIKTLSTNSNGEYRYNTKTIPLANIVVGLPCGNYTLTASKDGYIGQSFNIIVRPGETNAYPQQNATMSPAMTENDTWRIVLTWGANPRDLDSHVVGTLTTGNSFHVYYGHKSQYDGALEVCNLDQDDTTSYGPETITLNTNNRTPYYYYIHNFAGSGTLATSNAQITVYHGASVVRTFNVPTGLGDEKYWNVFAIVDGRIVPRNTITDSADVAYAGATGVVTLNLDEVEEKAIVP